MKSKITKEVEEKYGYKGWDYSELAEVFDINKDMPDETVKVLLKKRLKALQIKVDHQDHNEEYYKKIIEVRNFIKALRDQCERINYTAPLWDGLLEIQDSRTMLKYFRELLPHAWS